VAPLERENRILVARGLQALARTQRPGLRELLRLCELEGKQLTSADVSWRLAPRLNAPGRLGDAAVALQCLVDRDPARATDSAHECDRLNLQRREIQQSVLSEAREQLERQQKRNFLLAAGEGWHPGVVGIVAARLAEDGSRPAAVVALEGHTGRGSARSVAGIDLFAVLRDCAELFERYGGHAAAAGFTVRRDRIAPLAEALDHAVGQRLSDVKREVLAVDGLVALGRVTHALCESLSQLEPFGEGNPEPVLAASRVRVRSTRQLGDSHLALTVERDGEVRQAVGFGMLALRPEVGAEVDLAFVPQIDDYMGPRLRLRLVDLARAGEGVEPGPDGGAEA
jgi:single-stranded-DNA-specific exonuclease